MLSTLKDVSYPLGGQSEGRISFRYFFPIRNDMENTGGGGGDKNNLERKNNLPSDSRSPDRWTEIQLWSSKTEGCMNARLICIPKRYRSFQPIFVSLILAPWMAVVAFGFGLWRIRRAVMVAMLA